MAQQLYLDLNPELFHTASYPCHLGARNTRCPLGTEQRPPPHSSKDDNVDMDAMAFP